MSSKILSYLVRCMHTDKESTYFDLPADKIDAFLDKIRTKGIFWYSEGEIKNNGFWVNSDNIRFIQFTTIQGDKNESARSSVRCDGEVCLQKDADSESEESTT